MMAPEMATGPLEKVGPAADIYLLGATLFMIITGRPPHHAPNVSQCLRAVANNEICEFDPKYQGELMCIALKAMSLNPADRYAEPRSSKTQFESTDRMPRASPWVCGRTATCVAHEKRSPIRVIPVHNSALRKPSRCGLATRRPELDLIRPKFAHAEAAFQNEDFDLGLTLLDEQNPNHAKLIEDLKTALQQRRQRETRFAVLKKVAAALLAFILIGGSVAIFVINQARTKADISAQEAIEQTIKADQQRLKADEQRAIADQQRFLAESKQREAIEARIACRQKC